MKMQKNHYQFISLCRNKCLIISESNIFFISIQNGITLYMNNNKFEIEFSYLSTKSF